MLTHTPIGLPSRRAIGEMSLSNTFVDQLRKSHLKSAEVEKSVHLCICTHIHHHYLPLLPLPDSTWRTHTHTRSGYYARVKSIGMIVDHFIKLTNRKCQVVSYGAGFDTRYWTLHAASMHPDLYMEVDFASVVAKKCQYIK